MKPILALAWKDIRLLLRDRMGFFFSFAFPLIYAIFFGVVFSGDSSTDAIPVAMVDEDRSISSRAFVAACASGLLGAARAVLVLALFHRKLTAGQLLMDGIAVSPKMRGRGIGTKLLRRLEQYARNEGYESLRLDVIDTNPAARRLYERVVQLLFCKSGSAVSSN